MPTYCRISRSTALTCFCAALSQLLQELLRHSHSAVLMRARYDVLSQRERSVSVGQATGQTQLLQGSLLCCTVSCYQVCCILPPAGTPTFDSIVREHWGWQKVV